MSKAVFLTSIILLVISSASFTLLSPPELTPYPWPDLFPLPEPLFDHECVSLQGAELGRRLFYDPALSSQKGTSCATCHKQEFAFGDTALLSLGDTDLAERHTPPLFNLMWQKQFSWDARANDLETQTTFALHREMNIVWNDALSYLKNSGVYKDLLFAYSGGNEIDSNLVIKALAEFQMTLVSNRSRYDSVILGMTWFTELETKGFALFNDQSVGACLNCHPADGSTLGSRYEITENGLQNDTAGYADLGFGAISGDPKDDGKFKVPAVRNLGFSAPYMHDGSLSSIEEVLDFYSRGINDSRNRDSRIIYRNQHGALISEEEIAAMLAFLNTLNDTTFIKDPRFSDPWN